MSRHLPVFFGEYERTVDYKGRMTVPGHLLESSADADWSRVMVVKGEPGCLFVYDLATWKAVLDEAYRSMDDDEGRLFMHRALQDAHISDVDNLKRISVPAPLLQHAGVEKGMEEVPVPSIADLSRARIREVS
jgi:MraZ protein